MAYAAQHLLFRAGGPMGQTSSALTDTWSVGFRIFIGATPLDESKKVAFLDTVKTAVAAYHSSATLKNHPGAWLKTLTAAYIGMDGKYVDGANQPTTTYTYPAPQAGQGTIFHAYSTAMVLTLRSNISRGPGAYGRVYWPSAEGLDISGRWATTAVDIYLTAATTMLNAINQAARTFWSPASGISVFSNKGAGVIGTVVRVGIGRAPDSQRRRDNGIAEEHKYSTLTSAAATLAELEDRIYT